MARMKEILILALLGAAVLGAPGSAGAQEYYAALQLGYNVVVDGDQDAPPTASTSYDSRPAFAASFGYMDRDGLRIEGELGWRDNDLDQVSGADVAGRLTTLNLMVNILIERSFGGRGRYGGASPVRPYIGVGAGGGYFSMDYVTALGAAAVVDDQAFAWAWQGIAGLGFEISDSSILTLDYRYFTAENIGMTSAAAVPFEIDTVHWTFMIGVRTVF